MSGKLTVLAVILCLSAFTSAHVRVAYQPVNVAAIDINGVLKALDGVLNGLAVGAHVEDLATCIKDAVTVGEDFEQAIADFVTEDPTKVKEGIKLIGQALEVLPDAMTACQASVSEVEKVIAVLKSFTSPLSFVYHVGKNLIVNGVEIFGEINSAYKAYQTSDFYNFGYYIGEALAQLLLQQKQSTFETTTYDKFASLTEDELKAKYLGLELTDLSNARKVNYKNLLSYVSVPQSFDSRTKWANCIHAVRDQEHCGSCWAFSSSEVLSDRLCIASSGKVNVVLSPQYQVSCDSGDLGCQGGRLPDVWTFLENTGTVTDSCSPYTAGLNGTVTSCGDLSKCADGAAQTKYYAQNGTSHAFENPESIQIELMANGPVQTGFLVYDDFMKYKSGVYKKGSDKLLGGHAVKIVGWGVENGTNYWIAANSWGPTWGENGFFRIAFGECQFDENAYVGHADVTRIH